MIMTVKKFKVARRIHVVCGIVATSNIVANIFRGNITNSISTLVGRRIEGGRKWWGSITGADDYVYSIPCCNANRGVIKSNQKS
jgi:hypothetical protein